MQIVIDEIQLGSAAFALNSSCDAGWQHSISTIEESASASFVARQSGFFEKDDLSAMPGQQERRQAPCRSCANYSNINFGGRHFLQLILEV
jgi:hypothetical protein